MVECARLESVYPFRRIRGSNPLLSARNFRNSVPTEKWRRKWKDSNLSVLAKRDERPRIWLRERREPIMAGSDRIPFSPPEISEIVYSQRNGDENERIRIWVFSRSETRGQGFGFENEESRSRGGEWSNPLLSASSLCYNEYILCGDKNLTKKDDFILYAYIFFTVFLDSSAVEQPAVNR